MELRTHSPQGGLNGSGSGGGGVVTVEFWLAVGSQWVQPRPVSVYSWWEQPQECTGYWCGLGMVRTLDKASDSIIRLWAWAMRREVRMVS